MIPNVSFYPNNSQRVIEIIDLENLRKRTIDLNHQPETPHRLEFYMLIQITAGYGQHFIDFRHYAFQAHNLIFVNKHQIHAFDFSQIPQGKMILFTDGFIQQIQASMRIPLFSPFHLMAYSQPVFIPQNDLWQRCCRLIHEAEQELKHEKCDETIVALLFSALLSMIMREKTPLDNTPNLKQLKLFQRFGELLAKNFTQTRDANNYAQWLNVAYKTLNQVCKTIAHQTAKRMIDQYTTLEAKRRLALGEQTIQDLADELGFDEASNFVKYFKKQTGLTPSQFKKHLQS